MPYNIADPHRDIEDLVVRRAKVFREKQNINLLTGYRVEGIDPDNQKTKGRTIDGKQFAVAYDKLLIATGARPIIPDRPGFDLPGVMVLKSLEHARRIKNYLRDNRVQKAIIIGMGYIALEMTEALRALDIAVDMLKPRPVFLPWMQAQMAQEVKREVEANRVRLYAGQDVKRIEQTNAKLKLICTDMTLEGDMVLVAIGVTPNSEAAAEAGLALGPGNAISVNRKLQTSDENVFGAGDCADAYHVVSGQKVWIPLALRANRAGWAVADTVCGKTQELPGVSGTAVFKVFALEVARTGLNPKEARQAGFEPIEVTIKTRSRAHGHPGASEIWVHMLGDKKSGRLLGAQMVGREGVAQRINAAAVALHAQMTVEQFSQSDLAYAPPFGPTWDPLLTAANQLLKQM